MGYYVSHMIGIRTGGVFSDPLISDEYATFKTRIRQVLKRHDVDVDCQVWRSGTPLKA